MTTPRTALMRHLLLRTSNAWYQMEGEEGAIRFSAQIPGPWIVRGGMARDGRCWARIGSTADGEPETGMEDASHGELIAVMESLAAEAVTGGGRD